MCLKVTSLLALAVLSDVFLQEIHVHIVCCRDTEPLQVQVWLKTATVRNIYFHYYYYLILAAPPPLLQLSIMTSNMQETVLANL